MAIPSPQDFINGIKDLLKRMRLRVIIEPGRSLVGNTSLFVCKVTGVKSNVF